MSCDVVFAGVAQFPGVLPGAPQAGHGGERPLAEAHPGVGHHAGRAEPLLGRHAGGLLKRAPASNISTATPLTGGPDFVNLTVCLLFLRPGVNQGGRLVDDRGSASHFRRERL